MKKSKLITAEWLHRLGASCEQLETFRRLYPDGARIILSSARRCARANLDIHWLATRLWSRHWSRRREWLRYTDELCILGWVFAQKENGPLIEAVAFVHTWRMWKEK